MKNSAAILIGVGAAAWFFTRYASPLPKGSYRITSKVGPRISPIDHVPVYHDGLDLGAVEGTPIYAVDGGVVSGRYYSESGGNVTQIDSPLSSTFFLGTSIRWLYLHQSSTAVNQGDVVKKGQLIGYVGNTGKRTTGAHLHLEANTKSGKVLDPIWLGVPIRG